MPQHLRNFTRVKKYCCFWWPNLIASSPNLSSTNGWKYLKISRRKYTSDALASVLFPLFWRQVLVLPCSVSVALECWLSSVCDWDFHCRWVPYSNTHDSLYMCAHLWGWLIGIVGGFLVAQLFGQPMFAGANAMRWWRWRYYKHHPQASTVGIGWAET